MKKYEATSFTYKDTLIDGAKVMGNPATIFILEENEDFNRSEMSRIGIEEHSPMCCFVKNTNGSDYDIYYYNLDGSQAYACGHGTIATAAVLNKIFHDSGQFHKMGRFDFYFDKTPFKGKIEDNHILANIDGDGRVFIEQKIHNYMQIFDRNDNDIKDIMRSINLQDRDIVDMFRAVELNDIIFVLSNCDVLRNLKPKFSDMAVVLERMGIRNFCATAVSDLQGFNFESRVFVPHDNLDEDIACGSSNLTISKYWKNEMNVSNFKILFPYHMNYDEKAAGGVQFVNIKEDFIRIGGYCKVSGKDV